MVQKIIISATRFKIPLAIIIKMLMAHIDIDRIFRIVEVLFFIVYSKIIQHNLLVCTNSLYGSIYKDDIII